MQQHAQYESRLIYEFHWVLQICLQLRIFSRSDLAMNGVITGFLL